MSDEQTELMLTPKQRNKVKRALKALEDVRDEVNLESENNLTWYFEADGSVHLMDGESHDSEGSAKHGMTIDSFTLRNYDCGGW